MMENFPETFSFRFNSCFTCVMIRKKGSRNTFPTLFISRLKKRNFMASEEQEEFPAADWGEEEIFNFYPSAFRVEKERERRKSLA